MVSLEDESLKHCGYEDSVIRHLEILQDIEENKGHEDELDQYAMTASINKRYFTVKCIENIESLDLQWEDIDTMKKDFA